VRADRSGFEGPWTFSPVTFSNQYFTLLLEEPWQWRKWKGPAQYEDKKTKSLMMLP
jgi:cytochrome c peroxidase